MLIVRPIPGQEASNTMYLRQKEAAIEVDEVSDIAGVIENLLAHPEKLKNLSEAAARIAKPRASLDIAKLVLELCHKHD